MSTTTPPRRKVLICTIMRDVEKSLSNWYEGIKGLISHLSKEGWTIDLSVYENDSVDYTAFNAEALLDSFRCMGIVTQFRSEKLGTQKYGSVWSLDRINNLAAARQACLDQVDMTKYDKVCYIEPDVTYDPFWLRELILARHPKAAGIGDPDVYSGWSLRSLSNPKESVFLYDVCATRATSEDICWDVGESGGAWRGKSLVPTNLGGPDANCLHSVWSAFNCFCVYNAKPFKEGVRWGIVNKRVNPSRIQVGTDDNGFIHYLEADTVNICEQFRERGYNGIYLNTNCLIRHN